MSASDQTETHELTAEKLAAIEEKYHEGSATRAVGPATGVVLRAVALIFAIYHYITAGFGLPADHWHMGWHLIGLFILTYALFPIIGSKSLFTMKASALRIGNIPVYDIVFMGLGVASALYVSFAWRGVPILGIEEQTFRTGNPNTYDVFFGVVIILLVLDIARRTLGWVLPLIMGAAAFIMAEFLELPYTNIVIAAIFPALLHYAGVFTVVHLMARKLDLKGLTKEQLPKLKAVWSEGWANIVLLVGLLVMLFSVYTPFMSAFCGISLAVVTGMARLKEPPTLVYSAAFIAFVLWKFTGGGFDLTMTIILCAGSAMDDTVTILGAGIVGICCALSLQDRGVKVRLIDRGAPGQETSYGNAGIISPWSIVAQASAGHRP